MGEEIATAAEVIRVIQEIDFLKLAYLIEIAVVINLAYRELKFHQLDEKLEDEVKSILANYSNSELKDARQYKKLLSLIDCSVDKEIESCEDISPVWLNKGLKLFYNYFIRARLALTIVNISIISCILLLILITSFYKFETIEIFGSIPHEDLWIYLFYILSFMCLLPLVFIKLTTSCDIFLFGKGSGEKYGAVRLLKIDLDELMAAKKSNLKKLNDGAAGDLQVPSIIEINTGSTNGAKVQNVETFDDKFKIQ